MLLGAAGGSRGGTLSPRRQGPARAAVQRAALRGGAARGGPRRGGKGHVRGGDYYQPTPFESLTLTRSALSRMMTFKTPSRVTVCS